MREMPILRFLQKSCFPIFSKNRDFLRFLKSGPISGPYFQESDQTRYLRG